MTMAAESNFSALMRKTLDRQDEIARMKFKFEKDLVKLILLSYTKERNQTSYNEIIKILKDFPINDKDLSVLIKDCQTNVLLLDKDVSKFVNVLCNLDWSSRDEQLVKLYSNFILNLVTAHSYHCPQVMASLMKILKADGVNWDGDPDPETIYKWSNVHTLIAHIVALMPMSSELLIQTVIDQYPYYKAGCSINRSYIHNLIWVTKYIPALRGQLMTIIVSRMVIMDSNIDNANGLRQDTQFEMEVEEQDDVANTLDFCMLEVLRWLERDNEEILYEMCDVFEKVILSAHGINHVQYLILYTASKSQECSDRILRSLWSLAAGLHGLGLGAIATRRTATSHLTGLLARCIGIPSSRLFYYLRSMTDWCHSYITTAQEAIDAGDTHAKYHAAFYGICHGIFYLVAFKHNQLFKNKETLCFVENLNLTRLVTCALNPLATCPPQVRQAFASVTRSHQLLYCQAIIERNSRLNLYASTDRQYDEWYPYDPYGLPESGKVIWPLYAEYNEWHGDGDDEAQCASLKKKFDLDDDDFLVSASPNQKFIDSLSQCISPGFKTMDH